MKTKKVKSSSRKAAEIKPMYRASKLTKNSSRELWVAFPAGKSPKTSGYVFSSTLSRDTVRNVTAKMINTNISNIRSRRVKNLNSRRLTNSI